jgi:hypothetical protein
LGSNRQKLTAFNGAMTIPSKWLFIKMAIHQNGYSSKRLFIETAIQFKVAFYQSGYSSKQLFIKTAIHQIVFYQSSFYRSSYSLKQLFIEAAIH